MVAIGLIEETHTVFDRTALGIVSAEIEPAQAGMGDGTGAHGAGLERHIEIAAIEPARAAHGKRGANGQQLGMGGGIGQRLHAVALGREDAVALDDDGAHRGFAGSGSLLGEAQGDLHGRGLGHGVSLAQIAPLMKARWRGKPGMAGRRVGKKRRARL